MWSLLLLWVILHHISTTLSKKTVWPHPRLCGEHASQISTTGSSPKGGTECGQLSAVNAGPSLSAWPLDDFQSGVALSPSSQPSFRGRVSGRGRLVRPSTNHARHRGIFNLAANPCGSSRIRNLTGGEPVVKVGSEVFLLPRVADVLTEREGCRCRTKTIDL